MIGIAVVGVILTLHIRSGVLWAYAFCLRVYGLIRFVLGFYGLIRFVLGFYGLIRFVLGVYGLINI